MPVHNADIAAIFSEMADLLAIDQANPFRIRAYRNAARVVGELGREVRALVERGEDLTALCPAPGRPSASCGPWTTAISRCSRIPPAASSKSANPTTSTCCA